MHEFSSLEAKNRLAIVLLRSVETEERVKILLARYARPIYDTQYLVRLIRSPSFLHFRIPHFLTTACKTRVERAKYSALEIVHKLFKVTSTSF